MKSYRELKQNGFCQDYFTSVIIPLTLFFCKVLFMHTVAGWGAPSLAAGGFLCQQPEHCSAPPGGDARTERLAHVWDLAHTNLVCLVRCPRQRLGLHFLAFLVTEWPLLRPTATGCHRAVAAALHWRLRPKDTISLL